MAQDLNETQRDILINLVKQRPFLYDMSHPNYRNSIDKERAWKEISKLCKAPENSIKIFWKSLRDQYHRYMRTPANKRTNYRYAPKLTFLNGCVRRQTKKRVSKKQSLDVKSFLLDNSSNSSNPQIYKDDSDDYEDYNNEMFEDKPNYITTEYVNDNDNNDDNFEHEEITNEPLLEIKTQMNNDDPIYYNGNNFNLNNDSTIENKVDHSSIDITLNHLSSTINNLLERHFQTEEDDNDLFLKMIGKKMKYLPINVRNRLQLRFLQEVNGEVQKLTDDKT